MSPKVLILGHGWRMWNEHYKPRCAPMDITEWDELVQNAPKSTLTFMDFDKGEEPDIVQNVCNDWTMHLQTKEACFDYVIDTVCHFAVLLRRSKHYWNGVKFALKEDGEYIGWNDAQSQNLKGEQRRLRLSKNDIDEHVKKTYSALYTPKKPLEVHN